MLNPQGKLGMGNCVPSTTAAGAFSDKGVTMNKANSPRKHLDLRPRPRSQSPRPSGNPAARNLLKPKFFERQQQQQPDGSKRRLFLRPRGGGKGAAASNNKLSSETDATDNRPQQSVDVSMRSISGQSAATDDMILFTCGGDKKCLNNSNATLPTLQGSSSNFLQSSQSSAMTFLTNVAGGGHGSSTGFFNSNSPAASPVRPSRPNRMVGNFISARQSNRSDETSSVVSGWTMTPEPSTAFSLPPLPASEAFEASESCAAGQEGEEEDIPTLPAAEASAMSVGLGEDSKVAIGAEATAAENATADPVATASGPTAPVLPQHLTVVDYRLEKNKQDEEALGYMRIPHTCLYDAFAAAHERKRPILCIQIDPPGSGHVQVGRSIFSHPLIVEAADSLFVTVLPCRKTHEDAEAARSESADAEQQESAPSSSSSPSSSPDRPRAVAFAPPAPEEMARRRRSSIAESICSMMSSATTESSAAFEDSCGGSSSSMDFNEGTFGYYYSGSNLGTVSEQHRNFHRRTIVRFFNPETGTELVEHLSTDDGGDTTKLTLASLVAAMIGCLKLADKPIIPKYLSLLHEQESCPSVSRASKESSSSASRSSSSSRQSAVRQRRECAFGVAGDGNTSQIIGEAEAELAGLEGVLATKTGFVGTSHQSAVQVEYDSSRLTFSCLVRYALKQSSLANTLRSIYVQSNEERIAAQVEVERVQGSPDIEIEQQGAAASAPDTEFSDYDDDEEDLKNSYSVSSTTSKTGVLLIHPDGDPKRALRKTPMRFVPLFELQATRANRLIHYGRFDEAVHLLSPRQGVILMKAMHNSATGSSSRGVAKKPGLSNRFFEVVDVPILPAWLSVCKNQHPKLLVQQQQLQSQVRRNKCRRRQQRTIKRSNYSFDDGAGFECASADDGHGEGAIGMLPMTELKRYATK